MGTKGLHGYVNYCSVSELKVDLEFSLLAQGEKHVLGNGMKHEESQFEMMRLHHEFHLQARYGL